ncbi:MAG: GldG family protein [Verrucomicrobia subdivision 3 bacterium]|nr:GldG family protein [Limisphaerales bacterium]
MKSKSPPPSFSLARRWTISLNVFLSVLALIAVVTMANYLGARHYRRIPISNFAQNELSPQTKRILQSVTNNIHVIVYYDRQDTSSLYDMVNDLLQEYKFANGRIGVETVDYTRDPAGAQLVKLKYKLSGPTDKNIVIFDCNGRYKIVHERELSDLDLEPLMSGKSREVRRSSFKGELLFTSAIYSITSARSLKAYFLTGHGEHVVEGRDGTDSQMGFSKFAGILKDNNVEWSVFSTLGTNDIPSDCSLLIIAGPRHRLSEPELERIQAYLNNGGRALVMFNIFSATRDIGLERVLGEWGVLVGRDAARDIAHSVDGNDLRISDFSTHPITAPLVNSSLHVMLPRSLRKSDRVATKAGAPVVTEVVFTSSSATLNTDFDKNGIPMPSPGDLRTNISIAVAVEKGKLPGLTSERGTTRMVAVGDSIFLGNNMLDSAANRDFATLAINWLLDRSELLGSLAAKPIPEFRLIMTKSQVTAARLMLLLGMPGTVLLLGAIVWVQRRH